MRTLCFLFFLIIAVSMPIMADSPGEVLDDTLQSAKQLEIFELKSSDEFCPLAPIGDRCPVSNPLFYFKCCGALKNSCCFRLQGWAVAVLIILAVLVVISLVVNCIRCLCGR